MKRREVIQIAENIRHEFHGIRDDVERHFEPDVAIEHTRELLSQHVPALVVGRSEILLDSLLNYLMKDAAESLADAPTPVKNEFYEQELRERIKDTYTLEPITLKFSFDPRVVAGGIAAGGTLVAGGLIVSLVLSSLVSRIVAGLAALVASAVAFRIAHSAGTGLARKALHADISTYLIQSETQVSEWLAEVERAFGDAFNKFASNFGLHQGDA